MPESAPESITVTYTSGQTVTYWSVTCDHDRSWSRVDDTGIKAWRCDDCGFVQDFPLHRLKGPTMSASVRDALAALCLSSWTLNPTALADAIIAAFPAITAADDQGVDQ